MIAFWIAGWLAVTSFILGGIVAIVVQGRLHARRRQELRESYSAEIQACEIESLQSHLNELSEEQNSEEFSDVAIETMDISLPAGAETKAEMLSHDEMKAVYRFSTQLRTVRQIFTAILEEPDAIDEAELDLAQERLQDLRLAKSNALGTLGADVS